MFILVACQIDNQNLEAGSTSRTEAMQMPDFKRHVLQSMKVMQSTFFSGVSG
jgi:hypothetical protein